MAEIAHGTIGVDLDQGAALAELRKLKAEFDALMRGIDHSKAKAEIDATLAPLEDSIANAKRQLKILEATDTEVEIDGDTSGVKEAVAETRAMIKKLEAEKATIELDVKGTEKVLAAERAIAAAQEKRQVAEARHAVQQERLEQTASKRKLRLVQLEKEHAKAVREVEKAQRKTLSDMGRRPRGVSRMEARVELDIDKRLALEKLAAIKREMNILGGHPPVEINVDVDHKGAVRDFLADSLDRVKGWGKSLQDLRINLGPITTSLRGLAVGLSLFGPVILGLIGSLGALVASLGAAAAGAGAVGLAMVGGFVPAVLGGILVVKPMVKQLQDVHKAQQHYNDAVLKYGKHSKQAQTASKQLEHTLHGVDSETRSAIKSSANLGSRWNDITKPSRAAAWKVVGQALRTASSDLDVFGRGTNRTFGAAAKAVTGWLKGLRSGEAKAILGDLMGNFAKSIGPAAKGVGSLVTALGRIGRVASGFLPGLMRGFAQWAKSIADGTKNAGKLRENIGKMVDSMRNWGHLLQSTGRFLASFFGAGVKAGDDLVVSLTKVIDGWTRFNQSAQGQAKLGKFFGDAAANTKAFFSAMAPLAAMFVTWTAQMMPFVSGLLQGATAVGKFVQGLTQLIGLTGGVKDLGIVLGALFAIKRIGAIGGLLGLGGAGGGAAGGAAAGGAVSNLTRLRGVATKLVPALAGLGAISGGAATLGLTALAGAAAYGLYKLVTMKSASDKLKESIDGTNKATEQIIPHTNDYLASVDQASRDTKSYADSVSKVADAKKRLSKLEAEGKTNTEAYRQQTQALRDALTQRQQAQDAALKSSVREVGLSGRVMADRLAQTRAANDVAKAEDALNKARQPGAASRNPQGIAAAEKQLADARAAAAKAGAAVQQSELRMAASASINARAIKGMIPLSEAAAASLGRLAKAAPKAAIKIATKFEDPKDAARVASQANSAIKSGLSQKQVIKIVADSRSAEQAIARLKAARLDTKTMRILESGGQAAVSMLERIKGSKLTAKQQKIAQAGGPAVIGLLQKILGIKIPSKVFQVAARDAASGVIRSVIGLLGAVQNKTVTLTTIHRTIGGGLISGAGHKARPSGPRPAAAQGRRAGAYSTALVGEGGGPEILANQKTGMMAVVREPTFTALSADDFVIPTESRYRNRGRDLFAQFAKSMGIPGFRIGSAPPRTATKTAQQRKASGWYAKHDVANKGAYTEVTAVEKLQQKEQDQAARISLAEKKLKEPDSFIEKYATDDEGNDLYRVNQSEVTRWVNDLNTIRNMYNELVKILKDLAAAVQTAINAVRKTIAHSNTNIKVLNTQETHEKNRISDAQHSKGKNKNTIIANAKARLKWLQDEEERQKQIRSDAQGAEEGLISEQQFAGGVGTPGHPGQRILEAQQEATSYTDEAAGIAAMASAAATAANPQAPKPEAPPTPGPFDALNLQSSALEAEAALTAIGQGSGRTSAQIIADQVAVQNSIISTAKGMLSDTDPTNDADAYSAITSAAGQIQSLQGTPDASAPAATQSNLLSTARGDLFRSMGSNLSSSTLASGGMSIMPGGLGGSQPLATGADPAAGGSGGNVINVVNNYQTQPLDPHTWSRNVLFELQAAG